MGGVIKVKVQGEKKTGEKSKVAGATGRKCDDGGWESDEFGQG